MGIEPEPSASALEVGRGQRYVGRSWLGGVGRPDRGRLHRLRRRLPAQAPNRADDLHSAGGVGKLGQQRLVCPERLLAVRGLAELAGRHLLVEAADGQQALLLVGDFRISQIGFSEGLDHQQVLLGTEFKTRHGPQVLKQEGGVGVGVPRGAQTGI